MCTNDRIQVLRLANLFKEGCPRRAKHLGGKIVLQILHEVQHANSKLVAELYIAVEAGRGVDSAK